jgi:hypothetical protein
MCNIVLESKALGCHTFPPVYMHRHCSRGQVASITSIKFQNKGIFFSGSPLQIIRILIGGVKDMCHALALILQLCNVPFNGMHEIHSNNCGAKVSPIIRERRA